MTILIIVIIGLLATVVYLVWGQTERRREDAKSAVASFEECVAAGNHVMESQPRQCHDESTNQTFTEEVDQSQQPELASREYKSAKGVTVVVNDWADGRQVTSPLTITGSVPGSWSHEGVFPIGITYEGDIGLPGTTAKLQGDWMTDEMVPFTAKLTFDADQLAGSDGVIVLRKANPSGMPENDDSVGLKVRFAK